MDSKFVLKIIIPICLITFMNCNINCKEINFDRILQKDIDNFIRYDSEFFNFLCVSDCNINSKIYIDENINQSIFLFQYQRFRLGCQIGISSDRYHPFEAGEQFSYFKSKPNKNFELQNLDFTVIDGHSFFEKNKQNSLLMIFSNLFESDERYWQEVTFLSNLGYYYFKVLFVYDKEFKLIHRINLVDTTLNLYLFKSYSDKKASKFYINKIYENGGFYIDSEGKKIKVEDF